jgi:type IV secretory pathway TrbF-like protein
MIKLYKYIINFINLSVAENLHNNEYISKPQDENVSEAVFDYSEKIKTLTNNDSILEKNNFL